MTAEEAAAEIRELEAVRPRGGGTKLGWSPKTDAVDFDTRRFNRILEHNEGDFTAILEAGVALAEAQATFAQAGQMLAIDPPLGAGDAATIGGVMATNDAGPLRHRYGGMRDLVVGVTVVLSDGTVAQSGGKVIKNVAGYDLAKLFTGSFGTLGLIVKVAVRLHPAPPRTTTVTARSDNARSLAQMARDLGSLPLEADCLDVSWEGGEGRLDVRFGGATAEERAREAAKHIDLPTDIEADDVEIWARQRARQRSDGVVVKVSGRPTDLERVIAAAGDGSVVSRAALGISYVTGADVAALRDALAPRACTVLDGADRVDDPWPAVDPGALAVMERIKARFDPAHTFRPGAFVGGL
jgi:glycolate oxidase FAD binding subunit